MVTWVPPSLWLVSDRNPGDPTPSSQELLLLPLLAVPGVDQVHFIWPSDCFAVVSPKRPITALGPEESNMPWASAALTGPVV